MAQMAQRPRGAPVYRLAVYLPIQQNQLSPPPPKSSSKPQHPCDQQHIQADGNQDLCLNTHDASSPVDLSPVDLSPVDLAPVTLFCRSIWLVHHVAHHQRCQTNLFRRCVYHLKKSDDFFLSGLTPMGTGCTSGNNTPTALLVLMAASSPLR